MRLCRRSLCNLFAREPPDEFGVAAPWDETRLPSATCNPPLLLLILYRVFLQYYYSYFTRFLQYCHVCNTVPSICKCCLDNFTSMESTRWCWELFHFNLRLLNSSTSQQTQLRPPAFSSESLLTWQLLMKNCAPSNAFDILPNFEPILNGPVRCVRQCVKPLFVHHLQCFSSNPVAAFSLQFH